MDQLKTRFAGKFPTLFKEDKELTDRDVIHGLFQWNDSSTVEKFRRFFYEKEFEKDEKFDYAPVITGLCSAMNIVFCTGQNPEDLQTGVVGIKEAMSSGTTITHLRREALETGIDKVMVISLTTVADIPRTDLSVVGSAADPYVRFTFGSFREQTETLQNKTHATWNSRHRFLVRKNSVFDKSYENLKIELFDSNDIKCHTLIADCSLEVDVVKGWNGEEKTIELHKRISCGNPPRMTLQIFFVDAREYLDGCETEENVKWFDKTLDEMNPNCDWLKLCRRVSNLDNMRITPTERPIVFFNSTDTGTQGYISIDMKTKSVLVTFRGTQVTQPEDLMTDATVLVDPMCYSDDFMLALHGTEGLKNKEIKVHQGFLKAYNSVREAILQIVYSMTEWNDTWFIGMNGHSLGGALAVLCAYEFANRKIKGETGPEVGMFSVGAPRACTKAFVDRYNEVVKASIRFVKCRDIIPTQPASLFHVQEEVLFRGEETEGLSETGALVHKGESDRQAWLDFVKPFGTIEGIWNHLQKQYFGDITDLVDVFVPIAAKSQTGK